MSRDIRSRLTEGRLAPTLAMVADAATKRTPIEDLAPDRMAPYKARRAWIAAVATRGRADAIADAARLPVHRGGPPSLYVVARDGTVIADRPGYLWDPPDLAERLIAAHAAAKDGDREGGR